MQRSYDHSEDEPLVDSTGALFLRSKRTERMQRKRATRDRKPKAKASLSTLPTELLLEILNYLQPSHVFRFALVDNRFRSVVLANSQLIGHQIISRRYTLLAKCFPLPKFLSQVDPSIQPLLLDTKQQKNLTLHTQPYQHIHPPNPSLLCTCLTCVLTWNNLGLILDFAHWQYNLDVGEPIPILPRGQAVEWNQCLIERNAKIVRKALDNSLWYARILETHLDSTVRSIRRHQANKGNKRKHVDMTVEDAARGTDMFLSRSGPTSLEFPHNRDLYYMLEAYLPNRWWRKQEERWIYTIAGQHDRDLDVVVRFAQRF
ncbi:uncharacterized protein BDR25DRAFT_332204 [Lindgomyces ingoldianus]|uniref:Uncharacterized protein n=1 Tax=Lindgomyces ingoldianus TaxID=673940 RepID=A0ACB6R8R1_9PLEO|nr:uncharacterized protein BDR25DRAFT_332204 [Lindgomyces ingoldianus]KAF2474912.1 hypothetical protein BDR25DRAFT_332204 [Lindgomyces ingoldianus]